MREQIDDALAEVDHESGPRLDDRAGIARKIGVSVGTIDKLRAQGPPTIWVLDCPRFDVGECIAWLKGMARA